MKKLILVLAALIPAIAQAQTFSFATQSSAIARGDLLLRDGSSLAAPATLIWGTYSVAPNLAALSAISGAVQPTLGEFQSTILTALTGFTPVGSTAVNITGDFSSGTISGLGGQTIWFWAFSDRATVPTAASDITLATNVAMFGSITIPTPVGTIAYSPQSAINNGQVRLSSFTTDFNSDARLDLRMQSAVPEPSTYALLGGILALGFVMWRRRR